MIDVGFLTSTGWIILEQAYSALVAALVIAGIYAGIGLVMLDTSSQPSNTYPAAEAPLHDPASPPPAGTMSPLAKAFIIGLNAS